MKDAELNDKSVDDLKTMLLEVLQAERFETQKGQLMAWKTERESWSALLPGMTAPVGDAEHLIIGPQTETTVTEHAEQVPGVGDEAEKAAVASVTAGRTTTE